MPELPEVETIRRGLAPALTGRRVVDFGCPGPRQALPDTEAARRAFVGLRFTTPERRGKHLVLRFEGGSAAVVHLRMSGRFAWSDDGSEPRHVRAWWLLDDARRLLLDDARRFARVVASPDPESSLAHLGPEPLAPTFTAAALGRRLRGRRRSLKPLLLDQTFVAGLGNIYVDEVLHRAGLHPLTSAAHLGPSEVRALHRAIRAVLREAIARCGTSIDWIYPGGEMQDHLRVYGRPGEPCRRCGASIVKLRVAQRGTHVCPRCQDACSPRSVTAPSPASAPRRRP